METSNSEHPKVFISYSWSSPEHETWVVKLATALRSDGVDVILDKWDLREGQDKYVFMEQMVTDPTVQKVLVICDKRYKEKADQRRGGVGTESQIISEEIYKKVEQTKFIPIVVQVDDEGKPYLPVYLAARIYIDLSLEERFPDEYDKLLRNIYNRPDLPKPPLGTPPRYLFEDEPKTKRTGRKLDAVKNAILQGKRTAKGILSDYLATFLGAFADFRIDTSSKEVPLDQLVVDSIEHFRPYRDEWVELITFISTYADEQDYYTQLHRMLQDAIPFTFPPADVTSYNEQQYDNYKFMLHELFLYLIAVLIDQRCYSAATFFLAEEY
jgi:hypothetical protein